MFWEVRHFPACTHHVFLSHSREDKDTLIMPVYERLKATGIEPWIDSHHYPYGSDPCLALQRGVLTCRHTVFFVTESMLQSPRGWCAFELAYAQILQANLVHPGATLLNVCLPLHFVPQSHEILPRTVWQTIRNRGSFFDPSRSDDQVAWAIREITRFLQREQAQADGMAVAFTVDDRLRNAIPTDNGLQQRVARFDPQRLPDE